MLKAQKKLSRKELKQDALLTTVVKVTAFYEEHKKNIAIAAGVIVLAVVGSLVYFQSKTENNLKAEAAVGNVIAFYDNNQYELAISGMTERNVMGLKSIVDNYGNSDAGNLARFYLANAYYESGKYDEALKHFEDFDAGGQLLVVSRLNGIAACFEAKGEFGAAAEQYEKAATKYPKDVDAATNLNNAAANFILAGEKNRALDLYKKLKKDYPTSPYGREADRSIARLSV